MRFTLLTKFEDDELMRDLLETGSKEIIENTADAHEAGNRDSF